MILIQVSIIRANEFTTTDGVVSLLNLEAHKEGKLSSELLFNLESGIPAILVALWCVLGVGEALALFP
jgi:hypothetical protein